MEPEHGPLAVLSSALDRLAAAGPGTLTDGESVTALVTQLHRLEAVVAAATTAFEHSGAWQADGARSAAAWLAWRCRLPKSDARRSLHLGAVATALPVAGAAWVNGEIGAGHVRVLGSLHTQRTAELLERDQPLLVDHARTLSFRAFRQVAAYWEQHADPDGCEAAEASRRTRRAVSLHRSFEGMVLGQLTLDPVSGAVVTGELDRLERQLFDADVADARHRCERDPDDAGDLRRTAAQRRADALVEMATRSRSLPDDGHRPVPLFTVFVGYETLHGRICELANGQVVAPGALVPWLTGTDIERAVFRAPNRVEVSAATRFFTGATRRAIELRDRICSHPTCDLPAERCEADHVIPWAQDGPTTQENGRLLCGYHNRLRNGRPPPE